MLCWTCRNVAWAITSIQIMDLGVVWPVNGMEIHLEVKTSSPTVLSCSVFIWRWCWWRSTLGQNQAPPCSSQCGCWAGTCCLRRGAGLTDRWAWPGRVDYTRILSGHDACPPTSHQASRHVATAEDWSAWLPGIPVTSPARNRSLEHNQSNNVV